ncbi:hypothetical protein ABMZ28_25215, partial [Escherichia coli]
SLWHLCCSEVSISPLFRWPNSVNHFKLTEKGHEFLREVLPPQHNCLHQLWSALSTTEKDQLEQITRKLLSRLDQMEQGGVVLEAMS